MGIEHIDELKTVSRYKSYKHCPNNGISPPPEIHAVTELHPYDPVRIGIENGTLRKAIFEQTNGCIITYEKAEN